MKLTRSTVLVAAGAVGVVALLAWAFAPRPLEVEVATAARGRFEATIDEDAKTRLRERYVVSAPLAGVLSRITLREGDNVVAGDVVATLTPAPSPLLDDRALKLQQARLHVAEAQGGRAAARVEGARVALQQAANDARRSEQLARQGFVSATKLETDRLAADGAQKELDAAIGEQHVAEHGIEEARAALAAVRVGGPAGGAAFPLRSPVDGRVLRVAQASESAVALGTPLLEIGDTRALEIVAELLTADALRAVPGSVVRIERWGGDTELQGRVRLIEPGAFTKVSALGVEEQRVKVAIEITSPAAQWRALGDGYRVGVRVVTTAAEDALTVPVAAVFPLAEPEAAPPAKARSAVFRLDGDRVHLTPVEVAARNGRDAWVTQGLAAGAAVVVYPPSTLRDGARVTVARP